MALDSGRVKATSPRGEGTAQKGDPQDIADELLREANYVFGHYNLEIYLEAKPVAGS